MMSASRCGALAIKVNHDALLQALHSAKPTKAGERCLTVNCATRSRWVSHCLTWCFWSRQGIISTSAMRRAEASTSSRGEISPFRSRATASTADIRQSSSLIPLLLSCATTAPGETISGSAMKPALSSESFTYGRDGDEITTTPVPASLRVLPTAPLFPAGAPLVS